MSTRIPIVDDEPDVESMFRQHFRRDLRTGRFRMELPTLHRLPWSRKAIRIRLFCPT